MLVLSRKEGQAVMVGDDVRVTVVRIQGNRIRLGFEGPREVSFRREETHRKIVGVERREVASMAAEMT